MALNVETPDSRLDEGLTNEDTLNVPQTPSKGRKPPFDHSVILEEWNHPFSEGARLVDASRDIILKARKGGYQILSTNKMVTFNKGNFLSNCYSNADIIEFGYWNIS